MKRKNNYMLQIDPYGNPGEFESIFSHNINILKNIAKSHGLRREDYKIKKIKYTK